MPQNFISMDKEHLVKAHDANQKSEVGKSLLFG